MACVPQADIEGKAAQIQVMGAETEQKEAANCRLAAELRAIQSQQPLDEETLVRMYPPIFLYRGYGYTHRTHLHHTELSLHDLICIVHFINV